MEKSKGNITWENCFKVTVSVFVLYICISE